MTDTTWPPDPNQWEPQDEMFPDPDAPAPERTRRRRGAPSAGVVWLMVAAALIGAAVGAGAALITSNRFDVAVETQSTTTSVGVVTSTTTTALPAAATVASVAALVRPSIVVVEVGVSGDTGFVAAGGGSGVVLDSSHIVTNQHVVEGAEVIRVGLSDGRTFPATLVGGDELTDLAILAVDIEGLVPIQRGSTATMAVGDAAYAIGNPQILAGGPSVTTGVISAFGRSVTLDGRELFGMVQTDAPFTRGSSGGALVDDRGRLIGITTGVGLTDYGQEGIGFVIPIEMVNRITEELISDGAVSHAFLGVTGTTFYAQGEDGSATPAGVLIEDVVVGTAAEAAGILVGDVVTVVDGFPITTMDQLVLRMRLKNVGDEATFSITRDGETLRVEVNMRQRPEGV